LWFLGLLQEKGFKFCFRISNSWKDALELINSDKSDIDWESKRRSRKGLGKLKTYNQPTVLNGMRLVKVALSTGEMEVLATNLLDREIFNYNDLKELYNKRWGVEEAYKMFKKSIHIEHFTGKSARSVEQEFYAKIFMLNMAAMIRTQYIEPQKKQNQGSKHSQKVNKTQVLAKTKDFLIELFYSPNIVLILNQMKKMLCKCFDIIRPNRSFKRYDSSKKKRQNSMNHKGI
jgi:IS4 transposase